MMSARRCVLPTYMMSHWESSWNETLEFSVGCGGHCGARETGCDTVTRREDVVMRRDEG